MIKVKIIINIHITPKCVICMSIIKMWYIDYNKSQKIASNTSLSWRNKSDLKQVIHKSEFNKDESDTSSSYSYFKEK